MRYYIYLDKNFLKNIYSVMSDEQFSISVLELAEENGCRTTNHINIEPGFENSRDIDMDVDDKQSQIGYKNKHNKNMFRKRNNICYGYSSSCDNKKTKRYINIQDITDIKCLGFYHNLLEKLNLDDRSDQKIIYEEGVIDNYYLDASSNISNNRDKQDIVKINSSYICYDKTKLDIDLNLLRYGDCKIKVIGYILNDEFKQKYKLLKAIAIYIE